MTLDVYSHGIRVSGYTRETFRTIAGFLEGLVLKEPRHIPRERRTVMELKKRFYGLTDDRTESFIHRYQLDNFLSYMRDRGIGEDRIKVTHIKPPKSIPVSYDVFEHYVPHDYQIPIIETMADTITKSRRLDLQTGKGKTYASLAALQKRGERAVIMIPPKYFGIWTKALKDTFRNFEGRYITVSGSAEFKKLTEDAVEGELDADIIIISSMTYRTYIEAYERFKEKIVDIGYMVMPPRFHEALGVGYQINDEFHEDPGLVYRTDVYSNVAKQVYLSATPFTGNDFVTRMIDIMLPEGTECPLPDYDQYIKTVALMYSEPGITPKDYLTPFKNTYNHARYETRMALKKKRTDRYFDMVKRIIKGVYYRDREPGQKLLVLCATVKFIEQLTLYLKQEFTDIQVGAHVAGSSFEKLLTNDITVSTIKSAGTGVDIPDLRETLLLQATDSKKDNIQILGRLRHLKNYPGLTPRLTYMVCGDIPQHIRYHKSKQEHFKGKVIGHRVMRI